MGIESMNINSNGWRNSVRLLSVKTIILTSAAIHGTAGEL
jgi:hypothetical protein